MKVEISSESLEGIVVEELKSVIEHADRGTVRKAAKVLLTQFLTYPDWVALPKKYKKGVSFET